MKSIPAFVACLAAIAGLDFACLAASVDSGSVLLRAEPAYKGTLGRTVATSSPPSPAPPYTAPKGAPNVLLIMTDDTGFGSASTFGGPIPTPTRAALLTGRAADRQPGLRPAERCEHVPAKPAAQLCLLFGALPIRKRRMSGHQEPLMVGQRRHRSFNRRHERYDRGRRWSLLRVRHADGSAKAGLHLSPVAAGRRPAAHRRVRPSAARCPRSEGRFRL